MNRELSPSEAARRLGTTTRSVQRWLASGRLPGRRIGSRWRVASDALDAFNPAVEQTITPIRTLFVANRGEIAHRIARTCRDLGIRAVVPLTDGPGGLDLLDADAVVRAALTAGADALHPGFGFLAENADFAERVSDTGIRWLGPPPDAIRAMGDKARARRLATELGVPIVPGYDDRDQSDSALARAAGAIGVPLLVKPAAGGGGKGMRVVRDLARLGDALAGARREAIAAFGDDRVILERLIEGPRHVEVQVLFDRHGTGVHLGERDCSIQRRHQKVLEETPSPAVSPARRRRMTDDALRLARAVGYESAGTVEFLLDDRGRHYFLEMNTRLQVEHPVTEEVTGRDLVADQLRIAAGQELGIAQRDVVASGHAIEVRLYAEDAEAGFLPATGRIEALRWPAGDGIRVDSGVAEGDEVGGRFDPMLAKIIATGTDREAALDRLTHALDDTIVLGLVTNLRFLRWLVRQPVVRSGEARIDTLDRIWPPENWALATQLTDDVWQAAGAAIAARFGDSGDPWSGAWRVNGPSQLRLVADDGGERTIEPGSATEASSPIHVLREGTVHVDAVGRSVAIRLAAPPDVDRAARAAGAHASGTAEVVAPMPGAVLAVHVGPGDEVAAGDPIATLEAMKMEHVVAAPGTGRVTDVLVAAAEQVVRGQVLATLEA